MKKLGACLVVALALVLVLGCRVGAVYARRPLSSWRIVQAPHRACTGPRDPGMFDCLHPGAGQCFDTHAALNNWSRVSADFDSKQECDARLDTAPRSDRFAGSGGAFFAFLAVPGAPSRRQGESRLP